MDFRTTVLASLGLAMLLASGCNRNKDAVPATDKIAAVVKGAVVETVVQQPLEEILEASGTVRSRTAAIVSPRVPGTITVLNVKEGSRVKKGETLARLDARENLANAAAAEGGVEDARRALDEAKARKSLVDVQYERYQRLFKSDVISRQEFEIKGTEKELALQGVARAEARLRQAQEQASGAGAMADYTRLIAPISGIVTARQADLGATVFPGQPVMTIEDENGYQLELAVPESLSTKVNQGSSVLVTLDAVGGSFSARIAEIVPSADPLSRTFTAKIPLAQKGLKSGMFGRGAIATGGRTDGMTVPRKAVFERGALSCVWILDKDNIARMRIVKTGKALGERLEILSGLTAGERIVSGATERVSEGAKVE